MKNPKKCRHLLFWVHRVYGMQNERLDLTINEFFTVWKTMLLSQRYSQKCKMKKLKELEISLATKHHFPNCKKLVNREIETVVLMYINPINSKKSVTSFSWIFHFWLIDFSKKSSKFFFHPYGMPWGYVDLCKMLEVKKNNFWSRSRLLPRLLGLD